MAPQNENSSGNPLTSFSAWLHKPPLLEIALPAVTLLFGLEMIRLLVAGLTWVLGDRLGLGAIQLGEIALLIFGAAFLAGIAKRLLGHQHALILTAAGIGLMRLLIQIWWGEPLVNSILAMVGTICFALFLPLYLEKARLEGKQALNHFALGFVCGLILDTAIHGAFSTYDPIWRKEALPIALTLLLVAGQWLMLAGFRTLPAISPNKTASAAGMKALSWLAIGPFLFLELVVFQNIARLATLTGWPLPFAYGWTLLCQLLALAAAIRLLQSQRILWPVALIASGTLIAISFFPYQTAWISAIQLLLGQLSLTTLMVIIISNLPSNARNSGSITIASGLGMVLLVILLLGYYAVYQIALPYSNTILESIAAVIVAICGLTVSFNPQTRVGLNPRFRLAPAVLALFLILPVIKLAAWQTPEATAVDGFPVRVMTYNLHNGFNAQGSLNMEALARVIERNRPDIVALQEVSRGWLVNGRLDMLSWLSQRLKMPYVSGPTADPFWGNAILSRYPILDYQNHELPPRNLLILRGYTAARIDLGNNQSLNLIATHLHHIEAQSDIRIPQAQALLDFWKGQNQTVILGDFNALPDFPETSMFRQAGLLDSMGSMPPGSAYTFRSDHLYERIDYIWLSPDLKAIEAGTTRSTASDHLPVLSIVNK